MAMAPNPLPAAKSALSHLEPLRVPQSDGRDLAWRCIDPFDRAQACTERAECAPGGPHSDRSDKLQHRQVRWRIAPDHPGFVALAAMEAHGELRRAGNHMVVGQNVLLTVNQHT